MILFDLFSQLSGGTDYLGPTVKWYRTLLHRRKNSGREICSVRYAEATKATKAIQEIDHESSVSG